jgi:hypothetical protein
MRHHSIVLVVLIIFILVMSSHNSVAVTAQTGSAGLSIVYPDYEFYPQNLVGSLRFSIFNTTSAPITNANCTITIYNKTGQQQVNNAPIPLVTSNEYGYDLPAIIYTVPNTYSYTVKCNSTALWGYVSSAFYIKQVSATQGELPISITLCLLGAFAFSMFLASYFAVQKHPLVYLFILLAFFMADVLVWLNWRILSFNNSPLVGIFLALFIGLGAITFVMAIVTFLDILRIATKMNTDRKTKENIARFGYS